MVPSLADLYACGAVDADLEPASGRMTWRDVRGGTVGQGRGALILRWHGATRRITWAVHEPALADSGAPVVPVLDPIQPEGPVSTADAAELAADAAHELGYEELARVRQGDDLLFVALVELTCDRRPVDLPTRIQAVAAYLRGGGQVEDAAWRLRALAADIRTGAADQVGVAAMIHQSLAAGIDHTARELDADPRVAAAALEETAAGLNLGEARALRSPDELLAGVTAWMQGGGRDRALGQALHDALAELSQDTDATARMDAVLQSARVRGIPYEHLASALRQLLPRGLASAPLWHALTAAAPATASTVTLYNLGLALRTEVGAPDQAVELLARARDLSPDDAEVWLELGNARADAGDADGALAAWDRATQLEPTAPGPWIGRSRVLLQRGQLADALHSLARAADLTDHPELWHRCGSLAQRAGEVELGRESLGRAIAGYTRRLEADEGPGYQHFWRGAARAALGQPDAALADLEAAIAHDAGWAARAPQANAWASLHQDPRFHALLGDVY